MISKRCIVCRTCSPCIARVSCSKSASQWWRKKRKKKYWLLFCSRFLLKKPTSYWQAVKLCIFFSWGKRCEQKKQRGGVAGGDSPLILLIFFSRSPTSYSTPVSERLEQAMSTRNKRSGSAGRHEQLSVPRGVSTPHDSEWQGWSKDFWGFEIFDFGIFLGRKILPGIFQFGKTWFKVARLDFLGLITPNFEH